MARPQPCWTGRIGSIRRTATCSPAVVSIAQDTGDLAAALSHARALAALDPGDMRIRKLLLNLEKRQAR
jgi:hypothetical protein